MAKAKINLKIDITKAVKTIRTGFMDLSGPQFDRGLVRALNEAIMTGQVQSAKNMLSIYKVKSRKVKSNLKVIRARRGHYKASISANVKPMPLIAFNARQTRQGVTVNILGKRRLIKSAFIRTVKGMRTDGSEYSHKGVFARGTQKRNTFIFRHKQLSKDRPDNPIDQPVTVSPLQMLTNKRVKAAVSKDIERKFASSLIKQLKTVRRGF